MIFEQTPSSDPTSRPARVRFLAEIPLEMFELIKQELHHIPNWDRFFIMNNPVAWPLDMRLVIEQHLRLSA